MKLVLRAFVSLASCVMFVAVTTQPASAGDFHDTWKWVRGEWHDGPNRLCVFVHQGSVAFKGRVRIVPLNGASGPRFKVTTTRLKGRRCKTVDVPENRHYEMRITWFTSSGSHSQSRRVGTFYT